MTRPIDNLHGEELKALQTPVSLVYIDLEPTGAYPPVAMNDTDVDLYLDRSDPSRASMRPGLSGTTLFSPMAGLVVPAIEQSDEHTLSDVTLSASNVNQFWNGVLNDNHFRDRLVSIWAGAIRQDGPTPEEATFVGAVLIYMGRMDSLDCTKTRATIRVLPHSTPSMLIPHEPYSPDMGARFGGFQNIPPSGTKLIWGFSEKEI